MARRVRQSREAIEAEENIVIDAHLLIQQLLNEAKMSRAELARTMGISQARLSQVMAVDANPTLRTLAQLFFAMGRRARLDVHPIAGQENELPPSLETKSADQWHQEEIRRSKRSVDIDVQRAEIEPVVRYALARRRGAGADSYCNDNGHRAQLPDLLVA